MSENRYPSIAVGMLLALCLLLSTGCQGTPTSQRGEEQLPSLRDIRSEVTPPGPQRGNTERQRPERRTELLVRRIDLPLDVSLDEAWEVVDEGLLSERARSMWNANGLRIGRLSTQNLEEFREELPTPFLASPRSRFLLDDYPIALREAPRSWEAVEVDLAATSGSADEPLQFQGGQWQLLVQARPLSAAQANLLLLPYRYERRVSLSPPRDPLAMEPFERERERGDLLEQMAVQVGIQSTTVIVVGLHRPWPESDDDDDSDQAEVRVSAANEGDNANADRRTFPLELFDEDEPDDGEPGADWPGEEDEEDEDAPELPTHLGKQLFAASRMQRPIQSLLLISLRPGSGMTISAPADVSPEDEDAEP